jgi:hypothetical protein
MRDQLLRLILAQGTSAIGQFVRAWLLVMGLLICAVTAAGVHDHLSIGEALVVATIIVGCVGSLPVAVAIAIIFVAIKF